MPKPTPLVTGGLIALVLSVLLLEVHAGDGAEENPEAPSSSLELLLVNPTDGHLTKLAKGSRLPRSSQVVFRVQAAEGDYLYLLQKSSRGLEVLFPPMGLVWMRPAGRTDVVPRGPNARPEDKDETSWNADQSGELEFILVGSPAPRDIPSDGHTDSLERFLLPPPHVKGPAALPSLVLDRFDLIWSASDEPD